METINRQHPRDKIMGKPGAAIAVSSIGLAFQLLAFAFEMAILAFASRRSIAFGPFIFFWSLPFLLIGVIFLGLGVAGIAFLNAGRKPEVTLGGLLLIISSVFGFPTLFGFFIGSALMFIGGIMALLWYPSREQSLSNY